MDLTALKFNCLQRSVLSRGGFDRNYCHVLTALRWSLFRILWRNNLHDVAALRRALFEIFDVIIIMTALIVVKCVCEGDRREAELCLYTAWIVLEKTIRMVVLLLLLSLFGDLDLECRFGASNPNCRGRFSWVDWQKIDITPPNYLQPIELNETIPNHHLLLQSDGEERNYGWIAEFGNIREDGL